MKTIQQVIKKIIIAVIAIGSFTNFTVKLKANDDYYFSISSSSTSVKPGETVTINLNGFGLEGSFEVSVNNGAQITGLNPIWTGEKTTVKADSDDFTITVSPKSVTSSSDGSLITKKLESQSITIKVQQQNNNDNQTNKPQPPKKPVVDNRSKDNNLASLSLSEGTLSPAFSSNVTEYSVELKNTVEKITVNAKAKDGKAKVKGTGEIALKPGDNTIKITVIAENGNPKVYTIKAHVDETPLIFTQFNGEELGVVRDFTKAPALEGFEDTTVSLEGKEVKAWHSPVRNVTVVYLQKGEEKNYYVYNQAKGIVSIYQPLVLLGHNLAVVSIPTELQSRVGMKFGDVTIGELTLPGWTYEEKAFSNYVLIYALNEKGEYAYYQYEKTEDTLQLHSGAAALTQEKVEQLQAESDKREKLMFAGFGVAGVCFLGFVFMAFRSNRYKKLSQRRRSFDEVTTLHEEIDK